MQITTSVVDMRARASALNAEAGATVRPGLLVIGDDSIATLCSSGPLSGTHHVERMPTLAAGLARVKELQRAIVLTELDLPDGDGVELCAAIARTASRSLLTLVCTNNAARVPRALREGCHSVLLKPFAPNLLYARLGRLTRDVQLRSTSPLSRLAVGTNEHWSAVACPTCGHGGATSFDATSLRRAWYACLECEHVWIARRQQ